MGVWRLAFEFLFCPLNLYLYPVCRSCVYPVCRSVFYTVCRNILYTVCRNACSSELPAISILCSLRLLACYKIQFAVRYGVLDPRTSLLVLFNLLRTCS